jgi:hypothetical protein
MSTNKSSSLRFSDLAPSIQASALRRKEDKSEQSFNKHRKNTVFDKEVAHQVLDTTELKREHESDEDDDNEDTDSRVTIRDRQFEFSGLNLFFFAVEGFVVKLCILRWSRNHASDSDAYSSSNYWDTCR